MTSLIISRIIIAVLVALFVSRIRDYFDDKLDRIIKLLEERKDKE